MRDREDHVGRRGVLLGDAVDAAHQPFGLRIAELVGGDDVRAHGARAVEALALEPLAVRDLQIARADVVDHGVAEDVRERVGLGDVAPWRPDHDAQLHLPVHLTGDGAIHRDVVERTVHRGRGLREDDRHVWNLGLAVSRLGALLRVRRVVEAEAEDVLERPGNRRVQAHGRMAGGARRLRHGPGALPLRGPGLNQRQKRGRAAVGREVEHPVAAHGAEAWSGIGGQRERDVAHELPIMAGGQSGR